MSYTHVQNSRSERKYTSASFDPDENSAFKTKRLIGRYYEQMEDVTLAQVVAMAIVAITVA